MEKIEHIETIENIKEYINNKDYEGLKSYIEKREKEIINKEEDEASKYMDNLISNLR